MRALVLLAVALVACSGSDEQSGPTEPTAAAGAAGEAGAPSAPPRPPKPTAEELGCVQTESDLECRVEFSSACRAGEQVYLNRGCACDPERCERPAAYATTNYPGWCCRSE